MSDDESDPFGRIEELYLCSECHNYVGSQHFAGAATRPDMDTCRAVDLTPGHVIGTGSAP